MRWPEDPGQRRLLCEALLDWVAALEAAEPLPEGVTSNGGESPDDGVGPDLFRALGEVEALRREVALQGRTFARLADASKEASGRMTAWLEQDDASRRDGEAEARRKGRREVIEGLLAVREGLQRTLATAAAIRPHVVGGWIRGRARGTAMASLLRALEMNLDQADAALRDLDVRELRVEGARFDPRTMRAVEVADLAEGEPGTVVAVRRPGWMEGGALMRPAEVRAVPAAASDEEGSR